MALGRERVVLSATYGRRERETPCAGVLFRPGNRRRKAEWFDSTSSTWGIERVSTGSIVAQSTLSPPAVPWCSTDNHYSLWSLLHCFPQTIVGGRESCRQGFKSPRDNWEEEERGIPLMREMRSACALIPSPRVSCSTINKQEVVQLGRSIDSSGRTAANTSRDFCGAFRDICPGSWIPLWTYSSARIEHLASNSSSAQQEVRLTPHPITTGGSNQTVGSSNLPMSV